MQKKKWVYDVLLVVFVSLENAIRTIWVDKEEVFSLKRRKEGRQHGDSTLTPRAQAYNPGFAPENGCLEYDRFLWGVKGMFSGANC